MEAGQLAGLYIAGSSMEPTIADGDTVLVNVTRKDIVDGDVYALRVEGGVIIKRVQNDLGGRLRLINDNAVFKPVEVRHADVDVIGRVVWRGSLF
ncbi:S24 family peptidase [Paracidovorax cattleyae]|uniref:Peptidase S24-like n=1 Tax=Paracidovorax cattleyae TaxID=80868 RepID=A0A1H0WB76_9BURK|nr:S24 family peptidase [Paracidovorax cattleyae]SDP87705.1 Peptidase S24-like [Paracidovorax cattleyae]